MYTGGRPLKVPKGSGSSSDALAARCTAEAPVIEGWRQSWRSNPANFEHRVLRSLDGALARLQQLSARRWPWQQGDRALLLETAGALAGGATWRRNGDALRLLLQVWRHRDDPIFLPGAIEALADLARDENAVDELETYVPQIACMLSLIHISEPTRPY